jgi:hypothetical protein
MSLPAFGGVFVLEQEFCGVEHDMGHGLCVSAFTCRAGETQHHHRSSAQKLHSQIGNDGIDYREALPCRQKALGAALEEYRYRLYCLHPVIDLFIL